MKRIAALDLIVDFNVRALAKGQPEPYVAAPLLRLAKSLGVRVAPGDDSHGWRRWALASTEASPGWWNSASPRTGLGHVKALRHRRRAARKTGGGEGALPPASRNCVAQLNLGRHWREGQIAEAPRLHNGAWATPSGARWGRGMKRLLGSILALALAASSLADAAVPAAAADASPAPLPDPYALVAAAIDYNRGLTSYVEMAMLVHRPDWRRRSALEAWTRGRTRRPGQVHRPASGRRQRHPAQRRAHVDLHPQAEPSGAPAVQPDVAKLGGVGTSPTPTCRAPTIC